MPRCVEPHLGHAPAAAARRLEEHDHRGVADQAPERAVERHGGHPGSVWLAGELALDGELEAGLFGYRAEQPVERRIGRREGDPLALGAIMDGDVDGDGDGAFGRRLGGGSGLGAGGRWTRTIVEARAVRTNEVVMRLNMSDNPVGRCNE